MDGRMDSRIGEKRDISCWDWRGRGAPAAPRSDLQTSPNAKQMLWMWIYTYSYSRRERGEKICESMPPVCKGCIYSQSGCTFHKHTTGPLTQSNSIKTCTASVVQCSLHAGRFEFLKKANPWARLFQCMFFVSVTFCSHMLYIYSMYFSQIRFFPQFPLWKIIDMNKLNGIT